MFKRMTKEERKIGRRYMRRQALVSVVVELVALAIFQLAMKEVEKQAVVTQAEAVVSAN